MRKKRLNELFHDKEYKETYRNLSKESKIIINKVATMVTGRLKNDKVKTLANLIELLSSLNLDGHYIPENIGDLIDKIERELVNPWQAIELFIASLLNSKYDNSELSIEKWPAEIDGDDKVDFILRYSSKKKNIHLSIWTQLTIRWKLFNRNKRTLKVFEEKRNKLQNTWIKRRKIKNGIINKTLSTRYNQDALCFLQINNLDTNDYIHHDKDNGNKSLYLKAFRDYKENNFEWDLIDYLPENMRDRLYDVWKTIKPMIDNFINFVNNWISENNYSIQEIDWWNIYTMFPVKNKLNIWKDERVLYSVEFYMDDRLLDKIWDQKQVDILSRKVGSVH